MIVPLATGTAVAFWLLAPVMVLAAIGLVVSRKPVHSALCLATVMVSLAVQYAAQDAPFLFAVQVIVYTGAVLMLFLFVVMLVGVDTTDSLVETLRGQRVAATLAALGFGALFIGVAMTFTSTIAPDATLADVTAPAGGNVPSIAYAVFSRWIFIFEATAALLITAAIGAMVFTHRERIGGRITQRRRVLDRMQQYKDEGKHPGAEPTPGVFSRHNAVDTPALLPDGSIAESSVTKTLAARGNVVDAQRLAAHTKHALDQIDGDEPTTDDRHVLGTGDDRVADVEPSDRSELESGTEVTDREEGDR